MGARRQDLRHPAGTQPGDLRSGDQDLERAGFDRSDRRGGRERPVRRGADGLAEPAVPARRHGMVRRWKVAALHLRRRRVRDPRRYRRVGPGHENARGGDRRQALPRWQVGRVSPRMGPLHRGCRYQEGDAAYQRRHRDPAQRRDRLGLPGGTLPGDGLLVVARFEVDCLPAVRYEPRAALPTCRPVARCAPSTSRSATRSRARTTRRSIWAWCRPPAERRAGWRSATPATATWPPAPAGCPIRAACTCCG